MLHLQEATDHRLRGWLKRSPCVSVVFEDENAFANINDLQTLQSLEA